VNSLSEKGNWHSSVASAAEAGDTSGTLVTANVRSWRRLSRGEVQTVIVICQVSSRDAEMSNKYDHQSKNSSAVTSRNPDNILVTP
jgi:hypothetical protein